MLELINVKKTFNAGTVNEKPALCGVSLHLAKGDFATVIGGNGAGKSTMLNMIAGVYPIDSGQVILDPAQRAVIVALVMAVLSPIMAAIGQAALYNSTAGGLKDDGDGCQ